MIPALERLRALRAGKSPGIPIACLDDLSMDRRIEFEVKAPASASAMRTISGYALFHVCDDMGGACRFARLDVTVEVPVDAAAQEHGAFLDRGVPVNFAVPNKPAPVVLGLRLGNRVLVRRTDFGDAGGPVELKVGSKRLTIKSAPGRCQVLLLE